MDRMSPALLFSLEETLDLASMKGVDREPEAPREYESVVPSFLGIGIGV